MRGFEMKTKFKFIPEHFYDEKGDYLISLLVEVEIAHQLRRIADILTPEIKEEDLK